MQKNEKELKAKKIEHLNSISQIAVVRAELKEKIEGIDRDNPREGQEQRKAELRQKLDEVEAERTKHWDGVQKIDERLKQQSD